MLASIPRWARLCAGAVLLVILALSALPALAKQTTTQTPKPTETETTVTASGKLVTGTVAANGHKEFLLQDASGKTLYRLKFGPPWFADSSANPLNHYVNQQVTVTGSSESDTDDESAGSTSSGTSVPTLNVQTVNGQALRGKG